MAIENMPLTNACYKNLSAIASGRKTREQVTREITQKYKRRINHEQCIYERKR